MIIENKKYTILIYFEERIIIIEYIKSETKIKAFPYHKNSIITSLLIKKKRDIIISAVHYTIYWIIRCKMLDYCMKIGRIR